MMKKIILCIILGLTVSACNNSKIQVIENDNVVTNKVNMKSFNDEHYVWENFIFTTNKVNNIK